MEIEKLKSFFARIGGKSRTADKLISKFPPRESYNTYVEPFLGAGNVFFRIPYKVETEVINDFDDKIFLIFQGVKNEGEKIEELKPILLLTREEFYKLKESAISWIDYLILFRSSFFGSGKSFNCIKKIEKTILKTTNFIKIKSRLKDVEIMNSSFEEVVKKYNDSNTFFYLDPPYEGSKDYSNSVNPQNVYNVVKTIQGKFMLSYNDSPFIRDLFKEFNIHNIDTIYMLGGKGINTRRNVNEIYITNY